MKWDELIQIIGDNTETPKQLKAIRDAVEAYSSASNDAKHRVSGSASDFEKDLYELINSYVNAGLKKPDLVGKMVYITESCRVS